MAVHMGRETASVPDLKADGHTAEHKYTATQPQQLPLHAGSVNEVHLTLTTSLSQDHLTIIFPITPQHYMAF
jgi:hypothetical protein